MDDDGTQSYVLQQGDVPDDGLLELLVHHRGAAVLDDDSRAGEGPYVWYGLYQDIGLVHGAFVHHLAPVVPVDLHVVVCEVASPGHSLSISLVAVGQDGDLLLQ